MVKFEHLFSQDPIGAFEKIEQDYARYFNTAFNISNEHLDQERRDILLKDNNMSKEPYIEILPEYSPAKGITTMDNLIDRFSDAFGGKDISRKFFEGFISNGLMRGLMKDYLPHGHQVGMMEKAFAGVDENGKQLRYKNTVITSGTGSGKTEAFLLPLLADIFKESINWGTAEDHALWYTGIQEGRSTKLRYIPNQRANDPRPSALRIQHHELLFCDQTAYKDW